MSRPDAPGYREALQQIASAWDLVEDGIALRRHGLNHVYASNRGSGAAVISSRPSRSVSGRSTCG